MNYIRVALVSATASILMLVAASSGSLAELTQDELGSSRGAGAQARKCSESCNRKNNYADDCNSGSGPCESCTKATDTTYYLDVDPACGTGGFKNGTGSVDCGKKQTGTCKDIAVCKAIATSELGCLDPADVVPQP